MNKKRGCIYLIIIVTLLSAGRLAAQDLHFSQSYWNPQFQNPALTGLFKGDWRANVQYRSQWESVPVQYRTANAGADFKLLRGSRNMLGAGLLLQQDEAGDATLSWTQVGANISAMHAISGTQVVSLGFGAAIAQRYIDYSKLTFRNQWDGDIYNPSLPSREISSTSSGFQPTLSAGANWHFQALNTRNQLDIGASAFHLNRPEIGFKNDEPFELRNRYYLYAQGAYQFGEMRDLIAFAHFQQMSKAREVLTGVGGRYWLQEDTGIQFSVATRFADAIIPSAALLIREWTFGISYDLNISAFNVATGSRGGFELAVTYQSLPVKPVKILKVCPIF